MTTIRVKRTLARVAQSELVRIAMSDGRAFYSNGTADVSITVDLDRLGRRHELITMQNANDNVVIEIPNAAMAQPPVAGRDAALHLQNILHELTDGATERQTRMQERRMSIVRRLAALWTTAEDGASLWFHPMTAVSNSWIEVSSDLPDRRSPFACVATPLLGEMRRTRLRIKGNGIGLQLIGISTPSIARPITGAMDRLRAVSSFRTDALAIGIPEALVESAIEGAAL